MPSGFPVRQIYCDRCHWPLCQTASSQLLLKKSLFPLPLDAFLMLFLPEGLGLLFLFLSIPKYNSEDDEHLLMNDATVHVNM